MLMLVSMGDRFAYPPSLLSVELYYYCSTQMAVSLAVWNVLMCWEAGICVLCYLYRVVLPCPALPFCVGFIRRPWLFLRDFCMSGRFFVVRP